MLQYQYANHCDYGRWGWYRVRKPQLFPIYPYIPTFPLPDGGVGKGFHTMVCFSNIFYHITTVVALDTYC